MAQSSSVIATLILATACKADPNDEVCTHYAKLMVQCIEDKSENTAVFADTAHNFCIKGMSGNHDQVFGPRYQRMIECTRTATTCDALHACEDAAAP